MKKIILLLLFSFIVVAVGAQDVVSKFDLTGFDVEIVKSKKFSYACTSTNAQVVNGVLVLKASVDKEKLTIYAPHIERIILDDCDLKIGSRLKVDTLDILLKNRSKAKLEVRAKQMNIDVRDASNLFLSGNINHVVCLLDSISLLNSLDLKMNVMDLVASNKSIVNIKVETDKLNVEARAGSGITLRGTTKDLRQMASGLSRIKRNKLEANKVVDVVSMAEN